MKDSGSKWSKEINNFIYRENINWKNEKEK